MARVSAEATAGGDAALRELGLGENLKLILFFDPLVSAMSKRL